MYKFYPQSIGFVTQCWQSLCTPTFLFIRDWLFIDINYNILRLLMGFLSLYCIDLKNFSVTISMQLNILRN